ncbi:BA75_00407T0 [Komagataella pastoris]|uniref:BA75_00407T0 n=1 Tax=Komagataella pastoris TaxID=4922 RepID=A0A1B2J6D6_PICPA|nr:BA75_00407T0 [Komagataella pastoris]
MTSLPVLYKVITLQNLHSLYIQSYQRQEKEITLDMDKLRSSINASPLIDPAYDLCQIGPQKVQKDNQTSQMISDEQIIEIINEFFVDNAGQVLIPMSTNVFKISETISINTMKDRLIKVLNHYKNTTLREVAALEAQYHLLRTQKEKVIASEVLKEDEDESIDEVEDNKPEEKETLEKDYKADESNVEEPQENKEQSPSPKGPSKSELSASGEFANGGKEEDNMELEKVSKEEDHTSVEDHKENKSEEPDKELEEMENIKDKNTEKVESTTESRIEQQQVTYVKAEKEDVENSENLELSKKIEEKNPEKVNLVDTLISEMKPTETTDKDQQITSDETEQDMEIGKGKPIDNELDVESSGKDKSSGEISETPNGESSSEISQDEDDNEEANVTQESLDKQESQPKESRVEEKLSMESSDEKSLPERGSPSKEAELKRSHDVDESDQERSPSKRQKKEETQKSIKKFQTIASNLISQISSNRFASTFLAPVNKSEEPEYYKIVKQPQDLKTILKNCRNGKITNFDELTKVLQIMFTNAIIYNDEDSDVSKLTIEMMEETTKIIELFRESLD